MTWIKLHLIGLWKNGVDLVRNVFFNVLENLIVTYWAVITGLIVAYWTLIKPRLHTQHLQDLGWYGIWAVILVGVVVLFVSPRSEPPVPARKPDRDPLLIDLCIKL